MSSLSDQFVHYETCSRGTGLEMEQKGFAHAILVRHLIFFLSTRKKMLRTSLTAINPDISIIPGQS